MSRLANEIIGDETEALDVVRARKIMSAKITDWLGVALAAVAIIVTVILHGVQTGRQNQLRAEQEEFRVQAVACNFARDFLIPLQNILHFNKRYRDRLLEDNLLQELEYAPDYVQRFFADRSSGDPRRYIWKAQIATIMNENEKVIELIDRYGGRTEDPSFEQALQDFKHHARLWKDTWESILGVEPVGPGITTEDQLAPKFPAELNSLLDRQVDLYTESCNAEGRARSSGS